MGKPTKRVGQGGRRYARLVGKRGTEIEFLRRRICHVE
jgi:hypothetical protein